jgi:hypothetical protein
VLVLQAVADLLQLLLTLRHGRGELLLALVRRRRSAYVFGKFWSNLHS